MTRKISLAVALDPAMREAIQKAADAERITKGEWIRRLIERELNN